MTTMEEIVLDDEEEEEVQTRLVHDKSYTFCLFVGTLPTWDIWARRRLRLDAAGRILAGSWLSGLLGKFWGYACESGALSERFLRRGVVGDTGFKERRTAIPPRSMPK